MFGFELGREFRLSIAEIGKIFPTGNILFCDKKILLLENISQSEILEKAKHLGGTIKIIKLQKTHLPIQEILKNYLSSKNFEGKFHYGINTFGEKNISLKEILKISKKVIKESGLNPRFVNKNDSSNLSSIQIIKEALIKRETDLNFIFLGEEIYFGQSIFIQDIYGYSNRDYGKQRDMKIGMLPPKLAQIMINLGDIGGEKSSIYDPFVGLGTLLIEAKLLGYKNLFGSDINKNMLTISSENISKTGAKSEIFFQNAKYIHEVSFLKDIDLIATEGYLGEIMTNKNISLERILQQRERLSDLYEGFFSGLKKGGFKGKIVISFPFWDMKGKFLYFEEIYDILAKYTTILPLLPDGSNTQASKSGSLLYKRDSQLVGREIFLLKIK